MADKLNAVGSVLGVVDGTGLLIVLIAPAFGLAGTALGWWLNGLTESRRRRWQVEDDQRKWARDQRRESYVALLQTASKCESYAMDMLTFGSNENWLHEHGMDLVRALDDLEQKAIEAQLFGVAGLNDLAKKLDRSGKEVAASLRDAAQAEETIARFRACNCSGPGGSWQPGATFEQ